VTTKRRGMTEEAADAAIDQACRMLRMPTIRNSFTDYADRAGREQMSYRGFLAELLLAECDDRARRRSERRIKAAKFPREKSLRAFDFDANPNIDPAVIHTLAKCEWVQKGQPLCLIGDSGTGKSHLLIALGTEAAMAGYRVKYTLATQLANELIEAADEMTLAKTIARYGRVDLLCIDELGYMQLDRRGAELLFQVLTEREEKASVAIASNESFGGWTKTSPTPGYAQPSSTDSPSAAPSSRPAPTPTVWPKPQSSGQPDTRRARKRCRRKPTSAAPTRARRCQNSPTSGVGRNLRSQPQVERRGALR
jgi:DNA replication protein DnaC